MQKFIEKSKLTEGQVIPIVVLMMFAILGMAALLIDGGSVMMDRRVAQAAADAGALAGARALCYSSAADPLEVANEFAFANGAETSDAKYVNGMVSVTATVTKESYFAKIFSEDNLIASAEASAGCFAPAGNALMPIAWSCRPPVGGGAYDNDKGCQIATLDWDNLIRPLVEGDAAEISIPNNDGTFEMDGDNIVNTDTGKPPSQIYIIMDDIPIAEDILCKEELEPSDPFYSSALTCDLNGDGKIDIDGAGNRGWLDLDGGGGGAAEIKGWIQNGFDGIIYPHTWLSSQPGTENVSFAKMKDARVGDVVLIPVFNAICDDKHPLTNNACMNAAHASPFPPEPASGDTAVVDTKPMFHIVTFTPFYVSCVHEKKKDSCPGFELALALNPGSIKDNTRSIEGFFLANVQLQLDLNQICDVNLGNCTITLVQ